MPYKAALHGRFSDSATLNLTTLSLLRNPNTFLLSHYIWFIPCLCSTDASTKTARALLKAWGAP